MPKWITACVTLFAFLLVTLPAGRSWADDAPPPPGGAADDQSLRQAKQHFEAGKAAFGAHDFQAAIGEFKAAAALRPSPILDYNIGLATEQLGRPRAAGKWFRRYLEEKPDAENRAEVETKIAALDQQTQQQTQQQQQPQAQQPPQVTEDYNAQPQPMAQQPQYQGSDPYAGYQPPPPVGGPNYRTTPPKKKSYWWIVFPILGGITLLTLIIVASYYTYQSASTPYYSGFGATSALRSPALGDSAAAAPESGVLFRF